HSSFLLFCSYRRGDHQHLHSFPTRRSSDLSVKAIAANDASQRAIARRDAIDCASAACIVVTPKSGSSGSSSCTAARRAGKSDAADRKSTRLNSSHLVISYAVFCLKKKNTH